MSPFPPTPPCGGGCIARRWLPLGPDSIQRVFTCPALRKHKLSLKHSRLRLRLSPAPAPGPQPTTLAVCLFHAGLKGEAPCPVPRMLALGGAQSRVACVSDSTRNLAGMGTDVPHRPRRVPAGLARRTSQVAHTHGWLGHRLAGTLYKKYLYFRLFT